jgi:hypothetical protein
MKPATLLKALVIAMFVLSGGACSGPSAVTRAVGADTVGSAPVAADPPGGGIINREEYEHSASYPPG